MRALFVFISLFLILSSLSTPAKAQTSGSPPAPPSDFDPKAKAPPNLPATLEVPPNMRIEVKLWRKKPVHYATPPDPNNLAFLMDPDLEGAVIERDQENIHATFNWEQGRTSEAFIIRHFCFRVVNLKFPGAVVASMTPLNFWLNRQDLGGGTSDDFPGISWYKPSVFAGTASVSGTKVLIFPQSPLTPGTSTLPDGNYVCLDSVTHFPVYLDDGQRVLTFTYTPDSNIQINPQGAYLKAIQNHFGHWP